MHPKINLYIHIWVYIYVYICIYKIYLRMFGKMQQKVESIRNSIPICQVYENRVIFVLISTENEEGGGVHAKSQ